MKKVISGAALLVAGAILFLSVAIAGSFHIQTVSNWYTHVGRFWSAIVDRRLTPLVVVSVFMMLTGMVLLVRGTLARADS